MKTKTVPVLPSHARPLGPYSHMILANGFVFVSGQTGMKPGQQPTDLAGSNVMDQTRQCLRNVESLLKVVGTSLQDVVKATVYLVNPADYRSMNEAYKEFFPEEPPARSVARLGAEVPNLLVSIDAIAVHAGGTHSGTLTR